MFNFKLTLDERIMVAVTVDSKWDYLYPGSNAALWMQLKLSRLLLNARLKSL